MDWNRRPLFRVSKALIEGSVPVMVFSCKIFSGINKKHSQSHLSNTTIYSSFSIDGAILTLTSRRGYARTPGTFVPHAKVAIYQSISHLINNAHIRFIFV